MLFEDFEEERQFREAWESVQIARSIPYTLFTFGETVLPYYLVLERERGNRLVAIRKGEIRITRPLIITPESAPPELQNFFESAEDEQVVEFLLKRTAAFNNLKLLNQCGPEQIVTDSVQEAVEKLSRQLDEQDEDRVAILTAPERWAGVALIKYAAERVWASAPGNIQELRERGFLP